MDQITREDMNRTVTDFTTDDVELVEYRQDRENIYVTIFAPNKEQAAIAMEAMEDAYGLRIKTIKHDEDGYTKIHYIQSENQPKETVAMNTINFVATPDAKIIVINSMPTKRTSTVHVKALLPAVSLSTMRDRMLENKIKHELGFRPTPKADVAMKESVVPSKTTPSIQAELDMLKHIIAKLTPEAHAEAVKQGLIRGAQAQFNREMHSVKHVGIDRTTTKGEVKTGNRSNAIGKRQRAEVVKRECACGCGQMTGQNFAMGHDARARGMYLAFIRQQPWIDSLNGRNKIYMPADIPVTKAMHDYAVANPQWNSEIYAYVMGL